MNTTRKYPPPSVFYKIVNNNNNASKKREREAQKKPHDQATSLGPTTARRFPRGRPGSRREGGSRRVQPDLGITLTGRRDLSSSSLRHGHYGGVRVHRCSRSGSPCCGATPRGLKRRRMKRKKLSPKKKGIKSQTKKLRKKLREEKNHQKKETNLRDRILRQQTLPLTSLKARDTARQRRILGRTR